MLSVEQLSFGSLGRTILDRVSFHLRQGAITCLLGGNCSGKPSPRDTDGSVRQTTLFNLLTGLLRPQAGDILLIEHQPDILQRVGARFLVLESSRLHAFETRAAPVAHDALN